MKKILLCFMVSILVPFFAQANENELLICSPSGVGLDSISVSVQKIDEKNDQAQIALYDSEPKIFAQYSHVIKSGSLKANYLDGQIELILKSSQSLVIGGTLFDAAYLILKKENNAFSGVLAAKGNVYQLRCVDAN